MLDKLFKLIYKDVDEAVSLAHQLYDLAQVWDDLIDGDTVTPASINNAFITATIQFTNNPLWDVDIAANLLSVYLRWQTANAIEETEKSTDNDLSMAWMLRAGLYDLFLTIAAKLHGLDWAVAVGPLVYKTYGETLEDFIKEARDA